MTCAGGSAEVGCSDVVVNGKTLLYNSAGCGSTAAVEGLNSIVNAYSLDAVDNSFVCSVGGYFRDSNGDSCAETVHILNAALTLHFAGSFDNW